MLIHRWRAAWVESSILASRSQSGKLDGPLPKYFGTPPSVHIGQQFVDRKDLRDAGVHPPLMNGIHGTAKEGADSIVLSGGYAHDADFGDFILYSGEGGQDLQSKVQIADQSIDSPGNAGLITSQILGLPVRLTRGARFKSPFSPASGLRYAGLYLVTEWGWIRSNGFRVLQFRLDRLPEQEPYVSNAEPLSDPAFATTTISRRVRDSKMSRMIKALYEYRCQLCQVTIEGFGGRLYAEGAHVKPLGRPHLGTDVADNILCLCPNHHTQLDNGGLFIRPDMVAEDREGTALGSLTFMSDHALLVANAQYHRAMWMPTT